MILFLIAGLLQSGVVLPHRTAVENPAVVNPVPKTLQKDYDKLWKRFLTGNEDAKVYNEFDKLLKRNPDLTPALMVQFYLDLYAGREADAERRLESVLSKRPSDATALYYAAESAYSRSDYVRASTFYGRLLAVDRSRPNVDMKSQRALLLAMDGLVKEAMRAAQEDRLQDAEQLYRRALELAPQEGALHGQLAAVLLRANKKDESEAAFRRQAELSGASTAVPPRSANTTSNELEDLGRWGSQLHRFQEIKASSAITREQLAGLISSYFPQIVEFRQNPQLVTDAEDSWAATPIQTVLGLGLLDPMANHTFQPGRTVNRGEFAETLARLVRLLGVSSADPSTVAASDLAPESTLYRELQLVLGYGLMSLDNSGNFNVSAPVGGEEAVNTAEKLLRLIRQKAA